MAAAYEIKEIGFIGSLWQGEYNFPINIGKTVEITHVLNTIETSKRQSIFFATSEKFDLIKLNKQIAYSTFYYEYSSIRGAYSDSLGFYMQVAPSFIEGLVSPLFRYDRRAPVKTPDTSFIPTQENWSFNTKDPYNAQMIYENNPNAPRVNFVFLVPESYQKELVDFFKSVEQGVGTVYPPIEKKERPIAMGGTSTGNIITQSIVLPGFVTAPIPNTTIFKTPVANELEEIDRLAQIKFDSMLTQQQRVDTSANISDEIFFTRNVLEVNNNLKLVDTRIFGIREAMDQAIQESVNPFETSRQLKVDIAYLGLVRRYLLDSLGRLYNTKSPLEDPSLYENKNGIITLRKDIPIPPRGQTTPTTPSTPSTPTTPIDPTEPPTSGMVVNPGDVVNPDDPSGLPPIPTIDGEGTQQIIEDEIDEELDEFDELVDQIIDDLEIDDNNIYSFKKISKLVDYSLPIKQYRTKGLFGCEGEKLSTFYTGSLTQKQQKYYTTVFNKKQGTANSYHQFDITYCHISGSGSSHVENEVDLYPAKAMYRKYMLECFGHTNGKFPFKNGKNGDYFYVIQLNRDQYKEKLDAGNFELAICELSSSGTTIHPTSNKLFTLIDESRDTKQEVVSVEGISDYYYITSGSLRDGVFNESTDDAWGLVFPKSGLIILDGVVLDQSCSFNTATGSNDGQNSKRLFLSISGAAVPTAYRPSGSFFARSFETFLTETYFCRADYGEFNHSNNYTYTSGSQQFIKYDYFTKNPHSYITSIGLYNRKRELLAVGKLRKPLLKNEGKVCIFEVVVRLN